MAFGIFFGVNGSLGGGGNGLGQRDSTDSSGVFSRDIFFLIISLLLAVFWERTVNKEEINEESTACNVPARLYMMPTITCALLVLLRNGMKRCKSRIADSIL